MLQTQKWPRDQLFSVFFLFWQRLKINALITALTTTRLVQCSHPFFGLGLEVRARLGLSLGEQSQPWGFFLNVERERNSVENVFFSLPTHKFCDYCVSRSSWRVHRVKPLVSENLQPVNSCVCSRSVDRASLHPASISGWWNRPWGRPAPVFISQRFSSLLCAPLTNEWWDRFPCSNWNDARVLKHTRCLLGSRERFSHDFSFELQTKRKQMIKRPTSLSPLTTLRTFGSCLLRPLLLRQPWFM